jgi:simple sugar transport system permease protein
MGGFTVALFFDTINIGSIQLPIVLKLDSSIGGVLQGSLVLFVLIVDGMRRRLVEKS